METIIGFVAGYLVGVDSGRDGLERARSSWRSIRNSPELRRLLSEGAVMARTAVNRASRGGLGETIGGVTDLISARTAGSRNRSAA